MLMFCKYWIKIAWLYDSGLCRVSISCFHIIFCLKYKVVYAACLTFHVNYVRV